MKWEYKVLKIDCIQNLGEPTSLQNELNKYGEDGWELVGSLKKPQLGKGWIPEPDDGSVIFKRTISI